MEWYYVVNYERYGPVDDAELVRLAQAGVIGPSDLVWNAACGEQWVEASSVRGLFGPVPPAGESRLSYQPYLYAPTGGLTPNADLMAQARETLSGNWGLAVAVIVIVGAINFSLSFGARYSRAGFVFSLINSLISPALTVGECLFFLALCRKQPAEVSLLFRGFRRFGTALWAAIVVGFIVLLWSLLVLVPILAAFSLNLFPGIINAIRYGDIAFRIYMIFVVFLIFFVFMIPAMAAGLSYSMIFYIIADVPGVSAFQTVSMSAQMMRGKRLKLVGLFLRFTGWSILCILTCGIGFLFLAPYAQTSLARFYDDIKPAPAASAEPAAQAPPNEVQPLSSEPQPGV